MDRAKSGFASIDEYISASPEGVRAILHTLREAIHEEAPDAVEAISYGLPTFKLRGKNLVHFGAWQGHIGFYPTPSGTEAFGRELAPYKRAKGSIQFPIDQPLPLALIRQIVRFRVEETLAAKRKR